MSWATSPLIIEGQRVQIATIEPDMVEDIAEAIFDPEGWFGKVLNFKSTDDVEDLIESYIRDQSRGHLNPFVYTVDNEVAGITRFMRIDEKNRSLEIGGTWVTPRWRRTFVNTEVKYLLLSYCFEQIGCKRVEFRTAADNELSREALVRIGATFEGVLRGCEVTPSGQLRDQALYSILHIEWGEIKTHLKELLTKEQLPA